MVRSDFMPEYDINPLDLSYAKKTTEEFDSIKTHNKLDTHTNYLGVLGEMYFQKHLSKNKIPYEWIKFLKSNYTEPDFFVNKYSIDVKTTYNLSLFVQKATWDVYVLIVVEPGDKKLSICGWLPKSEIEKLIKNKKYSVKRESSIDYAIPCDKLFVMKDLEDYLKKDKVK